MILLLTGAKASLASDFGDALARVDHALRNNPGNFPLQALESCLARRNFARRQYASGRTARAQRSLQFCFDVLEIPETGPVPSD